MSPAHFPRPLSLLFALAAVWAGASQSLLGTCGPFTDTAADAFCPFILEIFTLGITTGTTPTTFDPASDVTRTQMAAFLSRSVDGVLKRGSRRAALDQFWTPQGASSFGVVNLPSPPGNLKSDGADVWIGDFSSVVRVRASDAKILETWTAPFAEGIVVAMNRVFVASGTNPGTLSRIDPSQPPGAATAVASNLGGDPFAAVFDGTRIWTANSINSVSIVTPGPSIPWTVTTVSGFSNPAGILFDGVNVWLTNFSNDRLVKLDSAGAVLQTVTSASGPLRPTFDGTNIWVPNTLSNSISVVRASTGVILATLTGNGLSGPLGSAFDGQRVLVTNQTGNGVSLWKAADLSSLGNFMTGTGTGPTDVCSDGINFWISFNGSSQLGRF
ncbi:MAG TPA: S-layer homology domain-containing protein [Thermoanaerobaculia bacterium]|nr:S-layer homology domain-containing protein [Thermoanaerobaculia bacterium]